MKRIHFSWHIPLFFVCYSIPIAQVLTRSVSFIGFCAWIISLCLLWIYIKSRVKHISVKSDTEKNSEILSISLLAIVHCVSLWLVGLNINHFHRDEFIMGYTSLHLPSFFLIDWFAGFPEDWIAQYPILFHALQKPFFFLFGTSLTAIRISIWPYCIGVVIYLYLLLRRKFSEQISSALVLLYIFWAPTLYFFSVGIHNISSTLFILGVLYHVTQLQQSGKRIHIFLSSLYLAASFLVYTGSYISCVIPLLAAVLALRQPKRNTMLIALMYVGLISFIILTPFIVHALTVHNYFLDRYQAVNLYNGYWTDSADLRAAGVSSIRIYSDSMYTAFLSLFIPGIAGFGGYYFGFQALFTVFSILLFVIGVYALLSKKFNINEPLTPYLLALILLAYIFGPATTIQPPAVHRLSVVFPLITMIMGYGLLLCSRIATFMPKYIQKIFFALLCIIFFYTNAVHFRDMMKYDTQDYPYTPSLTASIKAHIPGNTTIYIAAYYGFHLNKELFFRTQNHFIFFNSTLEEILPIYTGEPLIIVNPTPEVTEALVKAYPDHTIEYYGYEQYSSRILSEPCIFIYSSDK